MSGLADQLGHRAHRAADAPAAGLEQDHGKQAEDGGGQHDAIKPKSELGNAGGKEGAVISPVPGQPERPQQSHRLPEVLYAGKNQISIPQHLKEHDEEENQKSITEPFAPHPLRNVLFPGQAKASAQQAEQLSPAAISVAVTLCAPDEGNHQRNTKEQHTQPGEQDIKKAQGHVGQLHDPQAVIPTLFHTVTS